MAYTFAPALSLGTDTLAQLFTRVYAGYWHPIEIDAAALERMVAIYDLDLDASVVAHDGEGPVAVAMLAARDSECWIGGMGVLPEHRGNGLGARVTQRVLDNAQACGAQHVRLEVLVQNDPAIAIYRGLGFDHLQDVIVWTLDRQPDAEPARDVDLDGGLADLAAVGSTAPWQRNPTTIARSREAGMELIAVRSGEGTAVFSLSSAHAALYEIDAPTVDSAYALLRAPFDHGASSVLWLNGRCEGVAADALRAAGATELARQHELTISV